MVKIILVIGVIILTVYSVAQFASPQYNYRAFKSDIEEYMMVARVDPPHIVKREIMSMVREYNVPVEEDEVLLTKDEQGNYGVALSWSETVVLFPFYKLYEKVYEFEVDTGRS